MSIEKKKPTKEFYSALDEVITHQVKSREAFDKAIDIARKQKFDDFTIGLFIKDYLKDKIPKTSLYRYIKELNPVPLEQISYNNVLEVKDTSNYEDILKSGVGSFHSIKKNILDAVRLLEKDQPYQEYHEHIKGAHNEFNIVEKNILQAAKILEDKGYTKEQMISKIKRECKLADYEQVAIDFIDAFLRSQYKE